jgi:hypothetical protein
MTYNSKTNQISVDSLSEWFVFDIHYSFLQSFNTIIGWRKYFYGHVHDPIRFTERFYVWPIWIFVKLNQQWWRLGRVFRKNGWLKSYSPGEKPVWFWPIYMLK